ncbi:HVO_A0114 family putative DNA-binding protein [Salinarimonas ramus]|uniref:MarR family protein n=1 Tax=Salinarimonas ramus TaxID=690164 RepID=A0A917Q5L9_9HYPH|nr:MarR family transcriptional regulator [Salinarimonas ramus]GGK25191.1 hypothetical protein GCM10011322_09700 [Salinarimonas ramus]
MKIQSMKELASEMRAVARGEREAPADAALPSVESAEVLVRLLTPENRKLLSVIRDRKPRSVAELARMAGRAEPNVLRTLSKLETIGLVTMDRVANRRVPVARVSAITVEIDPFAMSDKVAYTAA